MGQQATSSHHLPQGTTPLASWVMGRSTPPPPPLWWWQAVTPGTPSVLVAFTAAPWKLMVLHGAGVSERGMGSLDPTALNSQLRQSFQQPPPPLACRTVPWPAGDNSVGQLGDGTTTLSSEPVKVAGDSTWTAVSVGGGPTTWGFSRSCGVQTDGSVWCWGECTVALPNCLCPSPRGDPAAVCLARPAVQRRLVHGGTAWAFAS